MPDEVSRRTEYGVAFPDGTTKWADELRAYGWPSVSDLDSADRRDSFTRSWLIQKDRLGLSHIFNDVTVTFVTRDRIESTTDPKAV